MHGWVLRHFWLRTKGRRQEQHEEAHGKVWIVVQGRLVRCAPEHLRHLSERESLSLDRNKGAEERARTFTDIVQDFKFSKGTHVDLRSHSDPPESPTGTSGTSSSEAKTETIPVDEPPIVSRDTKLEDPMPVTSDTPETRPVTETDETRMETDDHVAETNVPEPPLVAPPVPPQQLPRYRIHGKRESAVEHERSVQPRIELPEEDELFVSGQLQSFREQVREHVNDRGVEGIGANSVFSHCQNSEATLKDDSNLHRVSEEQSVELTFEVPWYDLEKFQAKPHSSRNLIASRIRKSAEVSLRQLDKESREDFDIAKSAEIQSWLQYEAVTAALRSQYHHRDIMKMRWLLRYKESGKPKARLVIIGYHDPRVGSDVRTEAPVASRRGRSLFFMATAHNQFSIEKGDVKNAFLQSTFDDSVNGELAAEPVPALRKALNLREDEIVVLTKACYGLIDTPRRWWKSLVRDTQQLA